MPNLHLRRAVVVMGLLACVVEVAAGQTPAPDRPRIYGIGHVAFRVSAAPAADAFYGGWLDLVREAAGSCQVFLVGARQRILLEPGLRAGEDERLVALGFVTESVSRLRSYLQGRGLATEDATRCGQPVLRVADPEAHVIEFVEATPHGAAPRQSPTRILHAGLTVRDVATMDKFYVDVLGFSEIWRGGSTDTAVDWINMKTPDGTEYIEYMLLGSAPLTRSRLGSMHHVALVVDDMQDAYEAVLARVPRERWRDLGSPRVGRNRRWQLNLFDPDGTRTELMERHPMRN
jgi:catechol 2,3-dioxygenase-like lactoylglutathione lyase family enzyme